MAQEGLEKVFLRELEALEKFRVSYSGQYPGAPLAHDDPDVRRLIEAMAFFTARTRVAAMRSLDDSVERIFRQHFPFLLGPVPAMAMLEATPGEKFSDVSVLPRGTDILLKKPPEHPGDPERIFRFRTLAGLRLLRCRVAGVDRIDTPGGGQRISIRITASTPQTEEIGDLLLHVSHLDDLRSSLSVVHELSARLASRKLHVSALYGPDARKDAPGRPCQVSFGPPGSDADIPDAFEQPLSRARLDARFPRQGLFMRFSGLQPGRNWTHITLCLDVSDRWPKQLQLTTGTFRLHTVPMINVRRELSDPIEHDGTKDRYSVKHPDPAARYAPLWAVGAYRASKQGFVPLLPGLIGAKGDTYEVVSDGEGEERRAWAYLQIEGAYKKPQLVSVDAFWHQPGLREVDAADLVVSPGDRHVEGVEWSLLGPIAHAAESHIEGERERQLQLVSMKTKRILGQDDRTSLAELRTLIEACGADAEPHLAKIVTALEAVRVASVPHGRRAHAFRYVYELSFGRLDPSDVPGLGMFCQWLLAVLRAWSTEEVMEIAARVPNLDFVARHV